MKRGELTLVSSSRSFLPFRLAVARSKWFPEHKAFSSKNTESDTAGRRKEGLRAHRDMCWALVLIEKPFFHCARPWTLSASITTRALRKEENLLLVGSDGLWVQHVLGNHPGRKGGQGLSANFSRTERCISRDTLSRGTRQLTAFAKLLRSKAEKNLKFKTSHERLSLRQKCYF